VGNKRGRARVWDTDDITLQHLYGLSLFSPAEAKPRFGSGITVPLTIGHAVSRHQLRQGDQEPRFTVAREGDPSQLPPTLLNLAWHFGHMQWALDNIAQVVRQSKGKVQGKDLDERFFIAAQEYAKAEFERKRVLPLRKVLREERLPLYFYCVPAVSIETELITGQPLTTEGDPVLCVLPKSVHVAQHYGLSEAEIHLLAAQVIWLIKNLCSVRAIRTSTQLIDTINGWVEYLSPGVIGQVQAAISQANPHLITPQVLALLPSA
jgi:hypothetical protein